MDQTGTCADGKFGVRSFFRLATSSLPGSTSTTVTSKASVEIGLPTLRRTRLSHQPKGSCTLSTCRLRPPNIGRNKPSYPTPLRCLTLTPSVRPSSWSGAGKRSSPQPSSCGTRFLPSVDTPCRTDRPLRPTPPA